LDWQLYKAFVFGTYEPDVVTVIQRHLRPGMVAVDCGAHIGYHTLLMAKCVGKTGKVYAFEPLPENFSVLCENIALNGYEGIVVAEKKAVGAQTGQQRFRRGQWRPDDLDPLTSVSCLDPQGDLEVEVVALDDYFADRRVDFLKIDVEGGRGNGAGRGAKIGEALDAYFAHQRAWLYTDPSCADDVERDGLSVEGIERVGCGAACFGVGKRERA
jgi:FkbM family methyltransferase